ncbi:MAG: site-specific integrase [Candidatus Bathyarchaeota archaeon]|nr:site-specific integrase [Candidatus Termiticorpusculum sp.]
MTNKSIHDYEQRLLRARRSIKLLRNGEIALQFLDHLTALDLSMGRVAKYAAHLPALLRFVDVDLQAITRADVERVVADINSSQNKNTTIRDKKLVLRKLVQYAKTGTCAKGTPLPPEVRWISLVIKEKDTGVNPENLLTQEEIVTLLKVTTNKRDRAMLYVLFEAALRPSELLTMSIDSVEFKGEYCVIAVNGRTGLKHIPLVVSNKPLLDWIQEHPNKDHPKTPLWCSLINNRVGEQLNYSHFRSTIKQLAQKAGLNKDICPSICRYTSLMTMAKVFTKNQLNQFTGLTYGSKMTKQYVRSSAENLEEAILELHGIKIATTKDVGIVKLVECPRCSSKNPFGNIRCATCGIIIDKETALKFEETQKRQETDLQEQKYKTTNES